MLLPLLRHLRAHLIEFGLGLQQVLQQFLVIALEARRLEQFGEVGLAAQFLAGLADLVAFRFQDRNLRLEFLVGRDGLDQVRAQVVNLLGAVRRAGLPGAEFLLQPVALLGHRLVHQLFHLRRQRGRAAGLLIAGGLVHGGLHFREEAAGLVAHLRVLRHLNEFAVHVGGTLIVALALKGLGQVEVRLVKGGIELDGAPIQPNGILVFFLVAQCLGLFVGKQGLAVRLGATGQRHEHGEHE